MNVYDEPIDVLWAHDACAYGFGWAWNELSGHEQELVAVDYLEAAREDNITVSEYRERLGGSRNLRAYVDCLLAGERRKAALEDARR